MDPKVRVTKTVKNLQKPSCDDAHLCVGGSEKGYIGELSSLSFRGTTCLPSPEKICNDRCIIAKSPVSDSSSKS
jgi:hypothetical protein